MDVNNQNCYQQTRCALCGADDAELMWTARDLAFGNPSEFPLVRCRQCGLIYLRVRPAPWEMSRYYPPEYKPYRPAIQDEHFWLMRWMRQRKVQRRRRIVERARQSIPGRILDVGCSTGIFLDAMRQAGWETQGIEIGPEAAHYARQRLGLDVFEGQLLEAHLPPGRFDVITFWDVLEHTFDPLETLREANRLLANGGILAMTLPNWQSLDRALFGREWSGYDIPRHLYVFTWPVLRRLLASAGLSGAKLWCDLGGYFTFAASARLWLNEHAHTPWLRRAATRFLDLHGIRFPFEPFFHLMDWLGRGGTLVVLAHKVGSIH